MNRRELILLGGAALIAPSAALAKPMNYRPNLEKELLAEGKTVFMDFKADWCGTCKAQERVLNRLKEENPAYEAHIAFVNVDWDIYGRSTLVQKMKIPRRSTLVVLKGKQELGRLVADTKEKSIRALMDTALAAAMEG